MRYEGDVTAGSASPAPRTHLDVALSGLQGQRELRLLRISVALMLALAALTVVWITPWLPIGMGPSDFSHATGVALLLMAALNIATGAILLHWAPLFTEEPRSELLRAILGGPLSVRSKSRFSKRLQFQCDEGLRGRNKVFALAVIQMPPIARMTTEGELRANAFLGVVRQVIRTADILGDSEDQEVWVLLAGAGPRGGESACVRIAAALQADVEASAAGADTRLRIGWSAFEVDGRDPETLLRIARHRSSERGPSTGHADAA